MRPQAEAAYADLLLTSMGGDAAEGLTQVRNALPTYIYLQRATFVDPLVCRKPEKIL